MQWIVVASDITIIFLMTTNVFVLFSFFDILYNGVLTAAEWMQMI